MRFQTLCVAIAFSKWDLKNRMLPSQSTSVARFTNNFLTLRSLHNSSPFCTFLTLLYQGEENCSTNMQLNYTQTFCKLPCDLLIDRGGGIFSTPPYKAWGISPPFGGVVNPYPAEAGENASWNKISQSSKTKGWWNQFPRLWRVGKMFLQRATDLPDHFVKICALPVSLWWNYGNCLGNSSVRPIRP